MQPILIGAIVFAIVVGVLQFPAAAYRTGDTPNAWSVLLSLIATIITLVSYVYYLLIATKKKIEVGSLFQEALQRCVPFIGLSIWVLLRTFSWIAIIGFILLGVGNAMHNDLLLPIGMLLSLVGIVCAIVLGPRYACAPAVWAMENKGVFASANRSMEVTRGYWGKVLGNIILLSVLCSIVIAVIGAILSPLSLVSAPALDVVIGFLSQLYQAFFSIFLVQLTLTLTANPRAKTAKA